MLGEVLSADGELARRKVFCPPPPAGGVGPAPVRPGPPSRSICWSIGPSQDPEVIPLVGVAGAREQPHALASVLATEQAIAAPSAASWSAPTPPSPLLRRWSRPSPSAEQTIGAALSAEQRQAAESICTLRARRRAHRGRSRRREDHLLRWWPPRSKRPAAGWSAPPPPARRPAPWAKRRIWASPGPWPACCGASTTTGSPRRAHRGHPRRGGHDRRRPPGRASPPASRPPAPSWCSSATTTSSARSAPAGPSPPWSDATPTSSTS